MIFAMLYRVIYSWLFSLVLNFFVVAHGDTPNNPTAAVENEQQQSQQIKQYTQDTSKCDM